MKLCKTCNLQKELSDFYPSKKSGDGYQYTCIKCSLEIKAKHRQECKEQGVMNYSQRTRQRLRLEILQHYGGPEPVCDCCGENHIEFLAIDHIEGKGSIQRKHLGGGLYNWLKRNNFPDGYRVLCHNCNQSLGAYGYCPHKQPNARPVCPPKRHYPEHFGKKSKKDMPLNWRDVLT